MHIVNEDACYKLEILFKNQYFRGNKAIILKLHVSRV